MTDPYLPDRSRPIDTSKSVTLDLSQAPDFQCVNPHLGAWLRIVANHDKAKGEEGATPRVKFLRWIANQIEEQAALGPAEPRYTYAVVRARVSRTHPFLTWLRDPDAEPDRPWWPVGGSTAQPWSALLDVEVIDQGKPF